MRRKLVLIVAALALVAAACSDDGGGSSDATIEVWAPSTLQRAMPELEAAYEAANPGVDVVVTTDGGARLVERIEAGERPDVYIDSSRRMAEVAEIDSSISPAAIGEDRMAIVVARGNPAGVADLGAFGDSPLRTAICIDTAPCGAGAARVFEAAGLTAAPDQVLDGWLPVAEAVVNDEADAGLLYRTEFISKLQRVSVIPLPSDNDQAISYEATAMGDSADGQAFVDWLANADEAAEVLRSTGLRALLTPAPEGGEGGDPSDEG